MGVAAADFDNDGWQDVLITAVGQNRLFRNTGAGTFADVTAKAGPRQRAGLQHVGALVRLRPRRAGSTCSSATTSSGRPRPTSSAASTASRSRTARRRPTAARRRGCSGTGGDGTFEDVTAKAGLFDATSKSLGVTLLDYDLDGWPDVFVANDTQPNKLYRNNGNGTFTELGLQAGLAFSEEGRARAGMGVDAADVDNTGTPSVVVTNFSGEMLGLYKPVGGGQYSDVSPRIRHRPGDAPHAGLRLLLLRRRSRRPAGPARGQRPHRRHDQQGAGARHLRGAAAPVPQRGRRHVSRTSRAEMGGHASRSRRSGRGAAFGDIDGDGDLDVLITSNGGPAFLYRNDVLNGNRVIRLTLRGTKSNRDAIGAKRPRHGGGAALLEDGQDRIELPVAVGAAAVLRAGHETAVDRVVIEWPSGGREELKSLAAGVSYLVVEGKGVAAKTPLAIR